MREKNFNFRSIVLLSFLLTWAAVAAAHVFYYSVLQRDRLNAEGERLAWREGDIPALRGKILDSKGIALAWTEISHDLILLKVPERPARRKALLKALAALPFKTAPTDFSNARNFILRKALTPEGIVLCEGLLQRFQELSIVPRAERRSIDYPEVKRLLGRTEPGSEPGSLRALDGEERLLDKRLSGRDGRFKVMLDKNGRWIEGTLKMLEQPRNGEDVSLSLSLEEIRYGASDGKR